MRIRNLLAVGALLSAGLVLPCAAQGGCDDCTITLALNSVDQAGNGTIDGTLTLNTTTDLFTGADLTASGFPGSNENGALTTIGQQGVADGQYFVNILSVGSSPDDLDLFLPTATLAGYDGSSISSHTDLLIRDLGAVPVSGSLESAGGNTSVTPEPGSLLLLATGLMGLAGLMWRRFAAV